MTRNMTSDAYLRLTPDEIMRMNEKELRHVVSTLSSTANKRIKRLEQSGESDFSAAYSSVQERSYTGAQGGKFGTAGKNLNQLRNEYKVLKNYLSTKTGSIRAFNKYRKSVYDRIGGGFSDDEKEKEFWRNYRKLEELHPEIHGMRYGSTEMQTDLRKVSAGNIKDVIKQINERNVSPNRKNREKYIDDLTNRGIYLNDKHRRVTVDLNDPDDVIMIMSMKVGIEYESAQDEYLDEDEDDFFTI